MSRLLLFDFVERKAVVWNPGEAHRHEIIRREPLAKWHEQDYEDQYGHQGHEVLFPVQIREGHYRQEHDDREVKKELKIDAACAPARCGVENDSTDYRQTGCESCIEHHMLGDGASQQSVHALVQHADLRDPRFDG